MASRNRRPGAIAGASRAARAVGLASLIGVTGLAGAGCGGSYPAANSGATAGAGASKPKAKPIPRGTVEDAKLPFRILRGNGGQEITAEQFYQELGGASAVCVGENHPNPHDHWAQLEVLDKLSANVAAGAMALGMEMFQRPFQGVLDDFAAGRIDEKALLSRTGWEERWGYDFELYRPMIELAVTRKMSLLALNAATELKKKVSANGPDGLAEVDRAKLPELHLEDADHLAWWNNIMAAMGGPHGHGKKSPHDLEDDSDEMAERARRMYAVQVLWDETMADTSARWLGAGAGRKIVILAGNGHCHTSAIVRRLQRRGVETVVSVRPIIDDGEGGVAQELATPLHDYLFVMMLPQ